MASLTKDSEHILIIGAGMAGLAAAIALGSAGKKVTLVESRAYSGGKMRTITDQKVDAGPTVFTMKYVFDRLFALAGTTVEAELKLTRAHILARHAWDRQDYFDLYADSARSAESIEAFFGKENRQGFERFSQDAQAIFNTLKESFMGAQRPSPLALGQRVGLMNFAALWALKPFSTLWSALGDYFPDPRLQQLYGRYATYVGSSPYQAPATLMLIAHVEQEGVWYIDGGMHALAQKMTMLAQKTGVDVRHSFDVDSLIYKNGRIIGVQSSANNGEILADKVLYCGDVSRLSQSFSGTSKTEKWIVKPAKRSLSAITFTGTVQAEGTPLIRHNVFFSQDYKAEFDAIFKARAVPDAPTVYLCAQDRADDGAPSQMPERMLALINAPAFGDEKTLTEDELKQCENMMHAVLKQSGVHLTHCQWQATQPSGFNQLFPASGGALYGRASHGWTASFQRPGAKTSIKGLYLAGGSVHPGAGVPMATLSGLLAAEQIIKDPALT